MKEYKVTIMTNRYPTDYNVQAGAWHVAIARAIKLWKKRFPSSQFNEMSVRVVRGEKIK